MKYFQIKLRNSSNLVAIEQVATHRQITAVVVQYLIHTLHIHHNLLMILNQLIFQVQAAHIRHRQSPKMANALKRKVTSISVDSNIFLKFYNS